MNYKIKSNNFAIILGGFGGIGYEIAKKLENEGIKPIIVDKLKKSETKYSFVNCDLTEPEKFDLVFDQIKSICGETAPYIINSAGIFGAYDDGKFDRHRLAEVMEVNVIGTVSFLSIWFEKFGKKYGGVVVNVSSAAARRGTSDIAYGMSMAALDSATRSLARAWAPSNVWVFGVAPGLVTTKMAEPMKPERRKILVEKSLIKRETSPEEVADLVISTMLSAPNLVAGTIINASGGV